jgi:LCP family protein required for cell wall assembly
MEGVRLMEQKIHKAPASKGQTRRLRKGRAAIVATILILLVAGAIYALVGEFSSTNTLTSTFFKQEKMNILVLGVDAREDDVGRSDTAFVVTIDINAKTVTMLSIPRDTRVKIDGHGWDKINHAYAFGGSKLSKSSAENLLGISIDYTVVMNFQGFVRMIDALGGVTIDVDKKMYYSDPYDDDGGLYIDLHPGVQKLNGKLAIEYVRYRDEEGDIGRVSRQQKFLKALLQEFAKPQLITKLPELIKEFAAAVKTDMPTKEMVKLIPIINDAAKLGLHTEWVEGTPCWIQGVSYWLPDIKELRAKVAEIQGITVDGRYAQGTERLEREYANSVPRETRITETSSEIQKDSNIEKQPADRAKAIAPKSNATTIISVDNKPKSTSIPANKQDIPSPKITKSTDIHSDDVTENSTGGVTKNTATATTSKQ